MAYFSFSVFGISTSGFFFAGYLGSSVPILFSFLGDTSPLGIGLLEPESFLPGFNLDLSAKAGTSDFPLENVKRNLMKDIKETIAARETMVAAMALAVLPR